MLLLAIAPIAVCATMLGGLFAFHLRDRLHLVLGFSAGAVVGVAFFDLLPEAIGYRTTNLTARTICLSVATGFFFYLLLDRAALLHSALTRAGDPRNRRVAPRGMLGAGSLVVHSLFDGIAIGFAFQVSSAIGLVVASAVVAHDFSDGINTMSIVLKNSGSRTDAFRWLAADALAPALGIALTYLVALPKESFGWVLALFAGFFLYLGASDLVPESHHAHPRLLTTATTLLGAAVVYAAVTYMGA